MDLRDTLTVAEVKFHVEQAVGGKPAEQMHVFLGHRELRNHERVRAYWHCDHTCYVRVW